MVWSLARAQAWYAAQGDWKQGVNFVPSYATNQIAMWQDYNATAIEMELGWAADLQYNALRVFLHDQLYTYEGEAFLERVDDFLTTADARGFSTILVLLEGIWDPHPQYTVGQSQAPPRPFVHNSRWLQSPGTTVLQNETLLAEQVRPYIQAVVQRFGKDERVLMLDLMDQPDNPNLKSYGAVGDRVPACQEAFGTELVPLDKAALIQRVLPQLLTWVDQALAPDERLVPITLADWYGGVVIPELGATIQEELRQSYLAASDILTFHHYSTPDDLLQTLAVLQTQYPGRPVVLSSFMARDDGSTFDPILGLLYARNVWAMNWGLVSGSIQTIYNSDSWNIPYTAPPDVWHHDVLWPNGTVYDEAEREYISSFRQIQDASNGSGDAGSPDSWAGAQWAATGLTVVSVLGIVGLVVTCAWYTLRRQRSRARARTISAVLEAAEQAEMVEMKGLT